MPKLISPAELQRRIAEGTAEIIDVRTPAEFAGGRIEGAVNIPVDQYAPVPGENASSGRTLVMICQAGGRAKIAAGKAESAGLTVECLEGGMGAWIAAGMPVAGRGGSSVISLERQVRIAAGSLVLAGVILGFAVHPVFFGLSGFVGAGLVFAGVTDTCGMGMLLAKAPWNRRSAPPACSATPAAKGPGVS